MSSYLSCAVPATPVPDAGRWRAGELASRACSPWVIAAGAGDLADPSGGRQESALVAGGRLVRAGQVMTFAVPVVTVPVKVGRSGAVQADGWLPGQVRLGLDGFELDLPATPANLAVFSPAPGSARTPGGRGRPGRGRPPRSCRKGRSRTCGACW
jgi:hypothetical protein